MSRGTVVRVLKAGTVDVPVIEREAKAQEHETKIQELYVTCKGNLVRVHEELATAGIVLAYTTLTGFCRRRGIGQTPKERVGHYIFEPGVEMQHDTSPHDVVLDGKKRRVQCASLVLGYSRMLFTQVFFTWNRFWAKVFLTDAIRFFGGAAARCMLDNSSVIVAGGTGNNAVMAPEMAAFGKRFGTVFIAHRLGDANRSAKVERPFDYIENNFYPGRAFMDVSDTNTQLRAWCERANGKHKRTIQAMPIELFATERLHLKPLPLHIPEVYRIWNRTGDSEGYVHLHTNRYSVSESFIDRDIRIHETRDRVRIFDGSRLECEHELLEEGANKRRTLPEHERQARWRYAKPERPPLPEEGRLIASSKAMSTMVEALKKRHGGRATRPIQRLHRMWLDYPQEPLDTALTVALEHGLFDLERIETLVLRHVAGDFFRLPSAHEDAEDPNE